jgi:alpha,alpha-trehalose phosphorylase
MLHHERLKPPSHDYPAGEWKLVEKRFRPEFLAQSETMAALGNGYPGMPGCPEAGGPSVENRTLINGVYETRPIGDRGSGLRDGPLRCGNKCHRE